MFPPSITRLLRELQKLPGVGEKTATRFVLHLLKSEMGNIPSLASALLDVQEKIRFCGRCFQLTESELCDICRSPRRSPEILCVVEDQSSLLAVENTRAFQGQYHVLGGHLAPMEGVGPEDLHLQELVSRVKDQGVREVILATNPDVEGEATALYVKRLLEPLGVRLTRIARGVPVGGDLEYSDALTLGSALEGRGEY